MERIKFLILCDICSEDAYNVLKELIYRKEVPKKSGTAIKDMCELHEISPYDLCVNPAEEIGRGWMLVSAARCEGKQFGSDYNTMTASWGGLGELWGKPVAFVFVRPERHTYRFTEESPYMTLTFFGDERKDTLSLCGSRSGRDTDKVALCGLIPVFLRFDDGRAVYFEGARRVLILKKLYAAPLNTSCFTESAPLQYYEKDGVHKMYVCEILTALER